MSRRDLVDRVASRMPLRHDIRRTIAKRSSGTLAGDCVKMGKGLKLLGGGANSQRLVPYLMRGLLLAISAITLLVIGGGSLSAQTTGSITGTVLLDDGSTAVNDAVVFVNEYRTGAAAGTTVTDTDGTYTVSGLEGGRYFVFVNAVRQGYPVQFYDGASDVRSATTVLVAAGDTTAGIDFALDSGGSISGTVLKASDGTAVSGAEVWAELAGGGGDGVRTASDGTYTITGLPAGEYPG